MLADAFSPRGSNAGRYGRGIRCKCAYGGTLLAVAALRVLLMGAAGPVEATPDNRLQVLKSKAMPVALDGHADAVPPSVNRDVPCFGSEKHADAVPPDARSRIRRLSGCHAR